VDNQDRLLRMKSDTSGEPQAKGARKTENILPNMIISLCLHKEMIKPISS